MSSQPYPKLSFSSPGHSHAFGRIIFNGTSQHVQQPCPPPVHFRLPGKIGKPFNCVLTFSISKGDVSRISIFPLSSSQLKHLYEHMHMSSKVPISIDLFTYCRDTISTLKGSKIWVFFLFFFNEMAQVTFFALGKSLHLYKSQKEVSLYIMWKPILILSGVCLLMAKCFSKSSFSHTTKVTKPLTYLK